jgi:hypothetical protein
MRSKTFSFLGICILTFVLTAQSGTASEEDKSESATVRPAVSADSSARVTAPATPTPPTTTAPTTKPNPSVPVYVPPRRGQPRARVGGGVRGPAMGLPTVRALVPDHVAHTARSQPALLWYIDRLPSGPATLTFKFNITSDEEIDPLIAVELEIPAEPGLQRIDLENYQFSLETGREYQWSVALVTDSDNRARDVVTLGWIERVEGAETSSANSGAEAQVDAASLAAAGLWYDAVDVADQADRQALLDQIGLSSAGPP